MPTRDVSVTEHQDGLVDGLVRTGEHQSASEVFRDGLRLLEQARQDRAARLKALQMAAQVGWDDLDAGRYTDVAPEDVRTHVGALRRDVPTT